MGNESEIRTENEILKLQLMAELGAVFEGGVELPAAMENKVLKALRERAMRGRENGRRVKLYDYIGRPEVVGEAGRSEEELAEEVGRMLALLKRQHVYVFLEGVSDVREVYRLITEELFGIEVDVWDLEEAYLHFTYQGKGGGMRA